MDIEFLSQRPYLTGLLLGSPVWLIGYILRAEDVVLKVALLFLVTGVVFAVYDDGRYKPVGKTVASAGATIVLIPIALGGFATLA
jgi:hypothetical protein